MNSQERDQLLQSLKSRFEANMHRHLGLNWSQVLKKLKASPSAIVALSQMEATGGEPDVIGYDDSNNRYIYCDCSSETPAGRRSLCFDRKALNSRKENKPAGSAMDLAASMGIELLTEELYRSLQELGEFDLKTSSWIATPDDVRSLGGALFGDRRYGKVFVYHNGAQSYYAVRGFRGFLLV